LKDIRKFKGWWKGGPVCPPQNRSLTIAPFFIECDDCKGVSYLLGVEFPLHVDAGMPAAFGELDCVGILKHSIPLSVDQVLFSLTPNGLEL
jgi:hypothetical protein